MTHFDPEALGIVKDGDVHGKAHPGHKVTRITACVVIDGVGNEGLASVYATDPQGVVVRTTLVASTDEMLNIMRHMIEGIQPLGGSFEWREYELVPA